jgi:hypothetical protein
MAEREQGGAAARRNGRSRNESPEEQRSERARIEDTEEHEVSSTMPIYWFYGGWRTLEIGGRGRGDSLCALEFICVSGAPRVDFGSFVECFLSGL